MELEFHRIITHPSLGLKNWNTRAILKFAEIYSYVIQIQNVIKRHKLTTRIKSKHSNFLHYKECIWLDPNVRAGPDTCVCCVIAMDRIQITRLLDELGRILRPIRCRSRSAHV